MNDDMRPNDTSAKPSSVREPSASRQTPPEHDLYNLLQQRTATLLSDLEMLKRKNVEFNPFLEIAAGKTQRSTALINTYPVDGVATDISQNDLGDNARVLSWFHYQRKPLLVCCDAHHLPFLPHSFNFVFVYQSLYQFANPSPLVAECYRVLGKGSHFFFNEEPMDSSFRQLLRGDRMLYNPPRSSFQKLGYRLGIEKVFWDDRALARSGDKPVARFHLDLWRKILLPFKVVDFEVNRRLRIHSNLQAPALNTLVSGVVGGNVRGLCMKTEGEVVSGDFRQRLMCVDCHTSRLVVTDSELRCEECGRNYPITAGIIRMLPREAEAQRSQTT